MSPKGISSPDSAAPRNRRGLLLAGVAIFIAVLCAHYSPFDLNARLTNSGLESLTLANHVAKNGEFASPFDCLETGPSAHLAPGFPILVALIIRLLGNAAVGSYILHWTTVLVLAIQLALFPCLARRLSMPPMAGILASLGYLVRGFFNPSWEVNYAGLLIVLITLQSMKDLSAPSPRYLIVLGALWGTLFLFSPVTILALPLWLIWVNRFRGTPPRSVLLLAFLPFVVVSPWLVRNYRVFNRFVFIRDNLGLELAVSNNSCATYALSKNIDTGCYVRNHPNVNIAEAEKVRSLGEPEYNQRRLHEAVNWIRTNPKRYAILSLERFAAFWFPWEPGDSFGRLDLQQVTTWVMTVLGILGLWSLCSVNRGVCAYLLIWLISFLPAYCFVVPFEYRHRIPILWATFIPASFFFLERTGANWDTFLAD